LSFGKPPLAATTAKTIAAPPPEGRDHGGHHLSPRAAVGQLIPKMEDGGAATIDQRPQHGRPFGLKAESDNFPEAGGWP
jgi:hypothetical protein